MLQERLGRKVGALEAKRDEERQTRAAIDKQLADSATSAPQLGPPLAAAATKDTEEAVAAAKNKEEEAAATKKDAVRFRLPTKNVAPSQRARRSVRRGRGWRR